MARAVPTLRVMLVSLLAALPVLALALPLSGYVRESVALWTMIAVLTVLYTLLRRGVVKPVFLLLVAVLLAYGALGTAVYGSIRSAAMYAFVGAVVVAGIFFDRRALAATIAASIACVGILVMAERHGWLGPPPDYRVGAMQWLNHAVALMLVGLNIGFAHALLAGALRRSRDELAERRAAESALARSEGRLQTIFRQSPVAIVVTDFDRNAIVDMNRAAEALFGVRLAEVAGLGTERYFVDAADFDRCRRHLESGTPIVNWPLRLRTGLQGRQIRVLGSACLIEEAGQRLVINQMVDVTAEDAAREALVRTEERFHKAFHMSPIGMLITRVADGAIIEANAAVERNFGFRRDEVIGRHSLAVGAWLSGEHRRGFVEALKRDGRLEGYEAQIGDRAGEMRDCRLYAERIEIDGEPCILCAAVDVSGQKRDEARVLEVARGVSTGAGREFFGAMAAHLGAAIGAVRVYVGECDGDLRTLAFWCAGGAQAAPQGVAAQAPGFAALLRAGGVHIDGAVGVIAFAAGGDSLGVAGFGGAALACLTSEAGERLGVLCAFAPEPYADARRTEALFRIFAARAGAELLRMRADRALVLANQGLEARVRQRTAQLEAANRELEAFSYSVSHDLRSPLRAIDGFVQILDENLAPTLAPDDRDLIRRIRAGAARMDALIGDLLELSRIGRAEVRRETVDLAALAREIAASLAAAEPARAVRWIIAPGLPASCDPALMRVVLENLLGNAWKFTRNQPQAEIEFGGEPGAGGETVLFVRDNGAGFDTRYADKLFAPFQRMHRQDEFEGTGIGLVTVQRIVARHQGRIWADAAPGRGATFRFTLGEGE